MVIDPIRVCARYKPKLGQGQKTGLSLAEFQALYQGDRFYSWFGLDNSLMYAAHKAAGGMTSVYRQIGIGCEKLFRQILCDHLGLSAEAVRWSYTVKTPGGKYRTMSLDGRIPLSDIQDETIRKRVQDWMERSASASDVSPEVRRILTGVVFEVRQGYKSKDSKRQNADIANAATAYAKAYLPCAVILSTQIDRDILLRYQAEKWTVLTGVTGVGDTISSTYDFMRQVIGFDLAAFFKRNDRVLRQEIDQVLRALLQME